ncbi:serine/threonine protein kinase [Synechococcus sp. PCC 7502]|uniref:serine/threonine-protein kinase n=1 Tax=Synechococcus sp. PCC 7502 TaxID=1173263 RepID=UPI00029FD52F|nr:serine/threonine-protein kinase [Synechococcus sp. PCC 7502]AFY73358.1 serine/threonine protein kinase [Synechococcus sp. PCC 7502]
MLKTKLGGRYSIISRLGSGGFGETYLAEDLQLPDHHCCVVKHLKPQSTDPEILDIARRLFDSEAKVLHRLGNNDQIPRLLANFEEDQQFYLVQEFIEGHGLDQELVNGKPWSQAQVINLLQDILGILEFVHEQKVIHRDLKPENLIRRNQDGKIVLIDFGAVKQIYTQVITNSKRAKSTITIGTSGYMPSEQANGHPQVNSDIYAVGVIAIQALTGLDPEFIPKNPQTLELEWSNLVEISPDLANILDKMVRYDFRQRYPSATAVLKDLESVAIASQNNSSNYSANHEKALSNQSTAILLNNQNQNLTTDIEISASTQPTQLEISNSSQPTIAESSSTTALTETLTTTKAQTFINQVTNRRLIGGAITILAIISGIAVHKLYQVNDSVSAPSPSGLSEYKSENKAKDQQAEALLQQVQVLDQVQAKIASGEDPNDIATLATQIPESSPLRNKVNTVLVKYQKQWEQDKLAFNEANSAYKSKNWKNALNASKKIATPYWQRKTQWIADKANTEIASATAPKPIVPPKAIVDSEYTAPPTNSYTPAPQPVREPTPPSKFSIPEAQ